MNIVLLHHLTNMGGVIALLLGVLMLSLITFGKLPAGIRGFLGGLTAVIIGLSVVFVFQDLQKTAFIIEACGFFAGGAVVALPSYPIAKFGNMAPLYLLLFGVLFVIYVTIMSGVLFFQFAFIPNFDWIAEATSVLSLITLITVVTQRLPKLFLRISGIVLTGIGSMLLVLLPRII